MGRCVSPSAEIQRERNLLDNMDESAQVVIEPLLSHRYGFAERGCTGA